VQELAAPTSTTRKSNASHFTASMQTEARWLVNAPIFETGGFRSSWLRVTILARKFAFRQGLWIEDLQIPPGQECSNGSLILLAVVLWRTFLQDGASLWPAAAGGTDALL
jgi:hypothetical protein